MKKKPQHIAKKTIPKPRPVKPTKIRRRLLDEAFNETVKKYDSVIKKLGKT